jgi:hypothetical protein
MDVDAYVDGVGERLERKGFGRASTGVSESVVTFQKRAFKVSKFGLVETVVAVFDCGDVGTVSRVRDRCGATFRYGLSEKFPLPRGLGSTTVVYPVFVGRDVSHLEAWVKEYAPKHWSAFEFPVVVDLEEPSVAFNESTPVWGSLYYRGFRSFASHVLAPLRGGQ